MNPVGYLNNIGPGENFLFEVKYLNLEYFFYKIFLFLNKNFGLGKERFSDFSNLDYPKEEVVRAVIDSTVVASTSSFNWQFLANIFEDFFFILIFLFMVVIAYVAVRMSEIREKEAQYLDQRVEEYKKKQEGAVAGEAQVSIKNPKWKKVVDYINSSSESDWKLSIIEADSMLDSLLTQLGFEGSTLGEKLKSANKDTFRNLNFAWESHAVRNKIAHQGTDFALSKKEATRIISLYEKIFIDYDYI